MSETPTCKYFLMLQLKHNFLAYLLKKNSWK